jgi:hypothetical protein
MLYTDATPWSIAAYTPGPLPAGMARQYDCKAIAFAEMAAALAGLLCINRQPAPTTITLCTDSAVVYHTLVKGSGITPRSCEILRNMYIQVLLNKVNSSHGLVVRWVPSTENLADPLSREVLAR